MKKVEAILDPDKLEDVRALLRRIGVDAMTVTDVRRFGGSPDHSEIYRGAEHMVYHLPKVKVEIVLEDGRVPGLLKELELAIRSGRAPEEKVFVFTLDDPSTHRIVQRRTATV